MEKNQKEMQHYVKEVYIINDPTTGLELRAMTELCGTLESLGVNLEYRTEDTEDVKILASLKHLRDHGEIGDGVTFDVNPTGGIIDAFCYGTRPTGEIAEISLVPIEDCDGECRSIYGGNA